MNLKDFYEDLPLGVCIIKRDRKDMDIVYANMVFLTLLGLPSDKDLKGEIFEDVWPDEEAKTLTGKLKSQTPPHSYVLPVEYDDIKRWIKLSITRDLWEGTDCYTLWATDISANKESEQRLRAEVEKADAMAEMKSNFLATMSHEIRTPMQTIYGLLELVGEEKPEERIMSMVDLAKTSASGLLEILDDILDLAKMDAEKMELDVFEVPVRLLVRGILEAMGVKVQNPLVELKDEIDENVPFVVIGDPKRLRQIILNLVGNALKFTEQGSVTVRVSTDVKTIDIPDNHVGLRFEVIDSGIGMSQEVCDKLFGSFTQADSSTSRKFGGTGLGLSISKKLVELMGGQIGVTSKEGKGSTFWFEIPTEEVSADENTIKLPKLDGISVIAVEDHPQGGKEIVNSLRSMGADIELCPTYEEGLKLIKRRPFDVGVIDQGLPDGLGLDLIKEIMDIRPYMGLVMYTVRDDVGLQHSLQSLGATYLAKPASRAGLGEAVANAASKAARVSIDGPAKLLIAEDTDSVRDVLQRQLEKIGVDADFVENGKQAYDAFKTGDYGLVITDLHMPEMDGYGLVEKIREDDKGEKHFPVIVLTADVQMAQRETYLRHGFDECLLKPVSLGQFRGLLARWGFLNESAVDEKNTDEELPESTGNGDDLPPAVDINAIKEQMGAFDEGTIEMMHMFVDMTAPVMERIQTALDNDDFDDLKEAGHSLKGSARSACCPLLGDLAGELQDLGDAQKPCNDVVAKIFEEFERVKVEVKALKAA